MIYPVSHIPIGMRGAYPALASLVHIYTGILEVPLGGATWSTWFVPLEARAFVGICYFPDRVVSYHRSTTGNQLVPPVFQIDLYHQPDTREILPLMSAPWSRTGWFRTDQPRTGSIDPIDPITVQHQESAAHPRIELTNVGREQRYDRHVGTVTISLEAADYKEQQLSTHFYELHLARSGPYHWRIVLPERVLTSRLAVRYQFTAPHLVQLDDRTGTALNNAPVRIGCRIFAEV